MGIREEVYYEGGPHIGDLIISILIGFTIIGLPLTVGAIVRALWLRFRITDRRISVMGGWMGRSRSDIIYSEIVKMAKVPRGLGMWGDMVITLRDGSRLEVRALPKFREIYDYIEEKVIAKNPNYAGAKQ
ncbi:MAG: PH domain-containing protein [Brasilonema octagenarum HA4186-MV1]|jgi:nitrogen fixation protein|uniref:PH domain-containing protein n=2 Tax=Brasilonema TaxID=383614 RepID=A0A856MG53_9CYAN|nr:MULTISPECIES: PH domain-containing protein [Brasilonema]MBW4626950.1 PH domain-containing protein [Brasilonema octagenarum HA4186-MV1]NMF64518.1 PH domain-containing protein [Brasilonema octagenarum UFV-OR1]QDL07936.1 PH domain-containing protein [Brasilonema sennae CENA114]QDL14296.1 PH domain-containing protein [Brasilonema octagenarum UFV-E1]